MPTITCNGSKLDARNLVSLTVGEVRSAFHRLLAIPDDAYAVVQGVPVEEGHRLRARDRLEFIEVVPGVGQVWTGEEFCILFRMTEKDLQDLIARGLPVLRLRDGTIRITETVVDDFFTQRKDDVRTAGADRLAKSLERIADKLDPPPGSIVGTSYVAEKLGVTNTYVAQMAREGVIPKGCIVPRSGEGNYWRFYRARIDEWINNR